jgi:A/G-specific adenine glycosylase
MLWLVDDLGRTLLERRPPSGIWGGLWSLPETAWVDPDDRDAAAATLAEWCSPRDLAPVGSQPLPAFVHDFSHYRLQVQPWRLQVSPEPSARLAELDQQRWVGEADLAGLGLPRPVQRLLSSRR